MHKMKKKCSAQHMPVKDFYQFVSVQAISVETDHKPLVALFKKPLNDCPLRFQRMIIVVYTPGKLMDTADALSRAVDPPKEPENTKMDNDVKAYVNMVKSALPVSEKNGAHKNRDKQRWRVGHVQNNHRWMAKL